MKNKFLKSYIENGIRNVRGFCTIETLLMLDHLNNKHMKGGVLEIGVHHGQFFIALNCYTGPDDTSFALDVFDNQILNIDNSGKGNLETFKSNLEKYDKFKGENVEIISDDSTTIDKYNMQKLATANKFKFISVDGGHTVEHVISDLNLASTLIDPMGVVIVDDWFNHWWPSVTEGITKYLNTYQTLVPFATSNNKMWMCNMSYKPFYLNLCKTAPFSMKSVKFYGHDIIDMHK